MTALLVITAACGPGRGTRAPYEELLAAGWIDSETIGASTQQDPDRLAALADAGVRGRLLRIDRLLDLYDGARFAADAQARESLWAALGGYATTQGIDASREVVLRLLDEAYAIEDLAAREPGALSEDEQQFVADAIMLLSTDLFLPDTAEALISQTLAYRLLAESGHPRIADNAHWRLYDHVRGVLEGASESGPELRPDILVHALYAEREDISVWLEDLAPHAQPPLPSTDELWSLLEQHRAAVEAIPRWQPVVAARAQAETELHETITGLLPWPRDPAWVLPKLPQGTAQPESLAPVVLLANGKRIIEPTSSTPHEQEARGITPEHINALESVLLRDGRGTVLLAADPQTPASEFATGLVTLMTAKVKTIELAVHEPRLDGEGSVVVALPLHLVYEGDLGPGARALREARIEVELTGRGPRFRVDGRLLSATPGLPSDVQRVVADLQRAYPRERVINLSIGGDVQPQQLIDLLATLTGGINPLFLAAGMVEATTSAPKPGNDPAADRALAARLALLDANPTIAVQANASLSEDDRARVEQAAASLRECVPELETALPKQGVTLTLEFIDGKLGKPRAAGKRVDAAALGRFEAC
ncbi:MAG TPA: hypothetical protein VM869_08535, partial [Enhygromyxa sp.]|nr:hypothetical protein [Enhygromyxa sp.]